jgi:hypothetical protein
VSAATFHVTEKRPVFHLFCYLAGEHHFPKLIGKLLEQVLPAHEPEADNSRAYITRHDQFDLPVGNAVAVFPTLLFNFIDLHHSVHVRRKKHCRNQQQRGSEHAAPL